jgi:hypothetical protein
VLGEVGRWVGRVRGEIEVEKRVGCGGKREGERQLLEPFEKGRNKDDVALRRSD